MRVLVTGASGFIGSHLCEALLAKGYKVNALIRYNSRNNKGWLETYRWFENKDNLKGYSNINNYNI